MHPGTTKERYVLQEEAEDMGLVHERRNCEVRELSGPAPAWPLPRSVGGHLIFPELQIRHLEMGMGIMSTGQDHCEDQMT